MTRRTHNVWLVVATLFTLANVAGAVAAGIAHESLHAGSHVLLAIFGGWLALRLSPWRSARDSAHQDEAVIAPAAREDRLAQLEQSVDAVAIEIERIGEGQRFMTRVLSEKEPPRPVDERAAPKPEVKPPRQS